MTMDVMLGRAMTGRAAPDDAAAPPTVLGARPWH